MKLPKGFVPKSIDQNGAVVEKSDHIFRFINPEKSEEMLNIFKCGLIKELTEKKLFPATTIIQYPKKAQPLILEHEKLENQTYPQEWSFDMLKDAAICTLKVNQIANKYGYQLIDSHPSNIFFNNGSPLFIDIGSLIPKPQTNDSWFAAEEFLKTFFYPLKLWSKGYNFIANAIIARKIGQITHSEYLILQYPILRIIPFTLLKKIMDGSYFPMSRVSSVPDKYLKMHFSKIKYKAIRMLIDNKLLPFQSFDSKKYINILKRMKSTSGGFWKSYQKASTSKNDPANDRFYKIYELIKKRNIKTIVDLASNIGIFSLIGIKNKFINKSICIDNENVAINKLYSIIKKDGTQVVPVVQNFIYPILISNDKVLEKRFRADAVVALAITHHLTLTQHIPLDLVFDRISKFTTKYAFIEFMPKGLWNGINAPPTPSWYTQEWFENKFKNFFDIEESVKTAENRILYVGKIKTQN